MCIYVILYNEDLGEMHIKKRGITHIKGRTTHQKFFLIKFV
jgi:predicted ribonuclease YlaK